jgi:hypothetical protein
MKFDTMIDNARATRTATCHIFSPSFRKGALLLALGFGACILTMRLPAYAGDSAEWMFASSAGLTTDATGNGHTLKNTGVTWLNDFPAGSGLTGCANFTGNQTQFTTSPNMVNMSTWQNMYVAFSLKYTGTGGYVCLDEDDNGYFSAPGTFTAGTAGPMVNFRWNAYGASGSPHVYYRQFATGCNDGNWHKYEAFITPSASPALNRCQFYRDGILTTDLGGGSDPTGASTAFANDTVYIGSRMNTYYRFVGEIADVKVSGSNSSYPTVSGAQITGGGWTLTVCGTGSNAGVMELDYGGDTYLIASSYSYSKSNLMGYHLWTWKTHPTDTDWTTSVANSSGTIYLTGSCSSFTVNRRIFWNGDKFSMQDTLTNKTTSPIAVQTDYVPVMTSLVTTNKAFLTGMPFDYNNISNTDEQVSCAPNPTVFLAQAHSSLGILTEDDVMRAHEILYQQTDQNSSVYNQSDISNQQFGLPGNGSYTFKFSLYPGGVTHDYWAFVNAVRRDWGVNYTILGPWEDDPYYFSNRAVMFQTMDPWYKFGDGAGVLDSTFASTVQHNLGMVANQINADPNAYVKSPAFMCKLETPIATLYKPSIANGSTLPGGGSPNTYFLFPLTAAQTTVVMADSNWGKFSDSWLWSSSAKTTGMVEAENVWPGTLATDQNPANYIDLTTYPGAKSSTWQQYGTNWAAYNSNGTDFNNQTQYLKSQVDFCLNTALSTVPANMHKGLYLDMFCIQPDGYDNISSDPGFYWNNRWDEGQWDGYSVMIGSNGLPSTYYTDAMLVGIPARAYLLNYILNTNHAYVVTNTHCPDSVTRAFPYFNFAETWQEAVPSLTALKTLLSTGQPWTSQTMSQCHLTSPISLGITCSDPTFNTTGVDSEYGKQHLASAINKYVILCLRNGSLMYYYSSSINDPGTTGGGGYGVMNYMFPFTPVELHAGYLIGKERILTAVSNTFYWNKKDHPLAPSVCKTFDINGMPNTPIAFSVSSTGQFWKVKVKLQSDWNNTCAIY